MELTFAQVARALGQTYYVAEHKRAAFVARLQHLQKLKFPAGINTGRGRAAKYDVGHLLQLGIVLELSEFGLTPERAINVILRSPEVIGLTAYRLSKEAPLEEDDLGQTLLVFNPSVLSAAMRDDYEGAYDEAYASFMVWSHDDALGWVGQMLDEGFPRSAMVNASLLWRQIVKNICEGEDPATFYRALGEWADLHVLPEDKASVDS